MNRSVRPKSGSISITLGGRAPVEVTSINYEDTRVQGDIHLSEDGALKLVTSEALGASGPRQGASGVDERLRDKGAYVAQGQFSISPETGVDLSEVLDPPEARRAREARCRWTLPARQEESCVTPFPNAWPRPNLGGPRVPRKVKKWARRLNPKAYDELRALWRRCHPSGLSLKTLLLCACRMCLAARRHLAEADASLLLLADSALRQSHPARLLTGARGPARVDSALAGQVDPRLFEAWAVSPAPTEAVKS